MQTHCSGTRVISARTQGWKPLQNLWWFSSACQCCALSWKGQSLWPDTWFSTAVEYMRIVWNCTKLEYSDFVFRRIQSQFSIISSPSFGHFLSALLICTFSVPDRILGVSSGCVLSKLQSTHDGFTNTRSTQAVNTLKHPRDLSHCDRGSYRTEMLSCKTELSLETPK